MEKKTTFTLINTFDTPSYDDYVAYCEDNDLEAKEEDSQDYWDWVSENQEDEIDCFYDNLYDEIKGSDEPCLIIGDLGLWDGRHEIQPVYMEDLASAVKKCVNCRDINDFEVELNTERGEINVNAYHHDGCNSFVIKALSKKGQDVAYRKNENCESLSDYKDYWFKKYNWK